jgi:hypothetical protein
LGLSARVALMWCESLIILNHASTDQTPQIIADLISEFGARVRVLYVHDTQWDEMPHRNMMLNHARQHGATHIAIIDADEILTGNLLGSIRDKVEMLPPGTMLTLPLYNLRGGLNRYHLNGIWGQRVTSVAFKDDFRAAWKGDKFHSREPEGIVWARRNYDIKQGDGGVLHLWGASKRRLRAKHALYKVTERLRWPDKPVAEIDRMYSWAIKGDDRPPYESYGTPATWTYADVPHEWLKSYYKTDANRALHFAHVSLDLNRAPWQEAEVRWLVAKHGRERFEGLDLFGVA